jgi:cytoskeletal protein CcmA (bactofilin family)
MAQLGLKQLDSILTGSLQVSGSSGVTGSLSVSSNIKALGNISGSVTSTGSFGSVQVAGNAGFREYIYHNGDRDTFIRLQPDEINIEAGGENMIYMVEGGGGDQADKVTINNDLVDVDFQVKGDNEANLIRTDAANDRVGIGTSVPTQTLTVAGNISASGDLSVAGGNLDFTQVNGTQFGLNNLSSLGYGFTISSGSSSTQAIAQFSSSNGNAFLGIGGPVLLSSIPEALTVVGNISSSGHLNVGGHITASGNISASGTIYADNFTSTGGDVAGISFADDLNITGDITGSGNLEIAGNISGSVTSTGSLGRVDASGPTVTVAGGSLVLGEEAYSVGANYVGLKTSFHTGSNDYMIISGKSDGSTYISAKDNSGVEIRGGGNRSNNSIIVPDDTYIKLGGSATTLLRPESDNTTDLGSAAVRYKDIHLAGDFSGSATSTGLFGALRVQSSILTINNGSVSGSATSTGSFGRIVATTLSGDGSDLTNVFEGTTPSASISTRLTTEEANVDTLQSTMTSEQTNIDNLQTDSGSFSTRITTAESELGNTLISGSAQIATEISGAFTAPSASISTRLTTAESELGNTLISGSAQLATDISGSWRGELSSSAMTVVGGGVSGSLVSTGSFGKAEVSTIKLGGTDIIATAAEINYLDGVVSNVKEAYDTIGYNTSTGVITMTEIDGGTDTIDVGVGTGDSPTFAGLSLTGDGSVTGSLVLTGNLTAQQYIVSSSVTNITTQQLSGSTIFGDTSDDTHQFIGNITGSNHISASGNITGSDIYSSGRIYEQGSSVIDHATAMAIVFGG